jgi:hypothetical protein
VRNSRRLLPALVAVALVVAACGDDRRGGPTGDPTTIVSQAPDRTAEAGTAKVTIATPSGRGQGTVDFAAGTARIRMTPASADRPPLVADPSLVLDVVRAAASVEPYGGSEVQGASTIRYELDIAPSPELVERIGGQLRGDTFYADVYIDADYRIRRVNMPLDLNERRPSRTNRILAKLLTIDFHDFPEDS